MLSADHALIGRTGTTVMQPGSADGGQDDGAVGTIARTISPVQSNGMVGAAITLLRDDVQVRNTVPVVGPITGIAERVDVGTKVAACGRTSRRSDARVTGIGMVTIYGEEGPVELTNMIMTSALSQAGDSGASVLTEDGRLVGYVYAGSNESTIVMPIKPVLDAVDVALLQQ